MTEAEILRQLWDDGVGKEGAAHAGGPWSLPQFKSQLVKLHAEVVAWNARWKVDPGSAGAPPAGIDDETVINADRGAKTVNGWLGRHWNSQRHHTFHHPQGINQKIILWVFFDKDKSHPLRGQLEKVWATGEEAPAIGANADLKSSLIADIAKELTASPHAHQALASKRVRSASVAEGLTSAHALASALVDPEKLDCNDAIAWLHMAHGEVQAKRDVKDSTELRSALDALRVIAHRIVPLHYDSEHVRGIRQGRRASDDHVRCLPHVLPSTAEITMAAVDGRPTRFRSRTDDTDYPPGELELSPPPEAGDAPWAERAEGFKQLLAGEFDTGFPDGAVDALHDFLEWKFVKRTSGPERSQPRTEKEARVLRNRLKAQVTHKSSANRTHYIRYQTPIIPEAASALQDVFEQLKRDVPALEILAFEGRAEDGDDIPEREAFGAFVEMLPVASPSQSGQR